MTVFELILPWSPAEVLVSVQLSLPLSPAGLGLWLLSLSLSLSLSLTHTHTHVHTWWEYSPEDQSSSAPGSPWQAVLEAAAPPHPNLCRPGAHLAHLAHLCPVSGSLWSMYGRDPSTTTLSEQGQRPGQFRHHMDKKSRLGGGGEEIGAGPAQRASPRQRAGWGQACPGTLLQAGR